jgi:nifR3 family TIM-barrel protein
VPSLHDSWKLGPIEVPNRVLLAPLAGIGNWFIRMQARRHGAGLAVSEMVSSFGIKYGDKRTLSEFLRIHPDEHPVSIQLFGHDAEVMKTAAEKAREAGAALIDINMGCPVRKVCKTGAGASLLEDPDRAVAIARGAIEGSGLPVTVKIRSGLEPGDRRGLELAHRLVAEAGVAGIGFHPRHASQQHKGAPDYALAAELAATLPAPVMLTGGLRTPAQAIAAYEQTGVAAVLIARGSLGNPWIFGQILGTRDVPPTDSEIVDELMWVMDCAEDHFGVERAGRWLRKAYPWYTERLGLGKRLTHELTIAPTTDAVRALRSGVPNASVKGFEPTATPTAAVPGSSASSTPFSAAGTTGTIWARTTSREGRGVPSGRTIPASKSSSCPGRHW